MTGLSVINWANNQTAQDVLYLDRLSSGMPAPLDTT